MKAPDFAGALYFLSDAFAWQAKYSAIFSERHFGANEKFCFTSTDLEYIISKQYIIIIYINIIEANYGKGKRTVCKRNHGYE